jgi:hypothetical protein
MHHPSWLAEIPECGDVDSAAGPNSGETVRTPGTFDPSYDAHHGISDPRIRLRQKIDFTINKEI